MTGKRLEELLEKAKRVTMTPEQKEAQRRSFAYGNAKISNEHVTMEMVNEAARRLDSRKPEGS